MTEKPCGCHPHIPTRQTVEGPLCLGCGWGGVPETWLNAGDVRSTRRREIEPPYVPPVVIPLAIARAA